MKLLWSLLIVLGVAGYVLRADSALFVSGPNLLSQVQMDEKTAEVVAKIEKAIDPAGMLKQDIPFQFHSTAIRTDAEGKPQRPYYTIVSGEFPGRLRIDVLDASKKLAFVLLVDGAVAKTIEKGGKITDLSQAQATLLRRQLLARRSFYAVADAIRLTGNLIQCGARACLELAYDFPTDPLGKTKVTDRILIDQETMLPQMIVSASEPAGVTRILRYTEVDGVQVATLSEMVASNGEKTLVSLEECKFNVKFPETFWQPEAVFAEEETENL